MKITMDGKYQTRDGRAVRILCVDGPDPAFPVVGCEEGNLNVLVWMADGQYNPGVSKHTDLIPVLTKHEGWIFFDPLRHVFNSKEEAREYACDRSHMIDLRLKYAHVTWESES